MNHDWQEGCWRLMSSAPFRLVMWILFGNQHICFTIETVSLQTVLFSALSDIGLAVYSRYFVDDGVKIGYGAHLAGILVGVFLGIPIVRNLHRKPWEELLFWISLAVFACLIFVAVIWNIFYPGFPDTDWRACCPFSYNSEDSLG